MSNTVPAVEEAIEIPYLVNGHNGLDLIGSRNSGVRYLEDGRVQHRLHPPEHQRDVAIWKSCMSDCAATEESRGARGLQGTLSGAMPIVRWCLNGDAPVCMIPTLSMYAHVLPFL